LTVTPNRRERIVPPTIAVRLEEETSEPELLFCGEH
jgi:hypothetical protein